MFRDVIKATIKADKLSIPAVQAVMEKLTMPCVRQWMKTANPAILNNDFIATIHNYNFEPGTLGYEYHKWLLSHKFILNPISEKATRFKGDPREKLFISNLGIVHDLLHVTYGHDVDTLGEATLAAWTHGNLKDQGQRLMLWAYAISHPWVTKKLLKAYFDGKKIRKVTQIDWEKLTRMRFEPLRLNNENTR